MSDYPMLISNKLHSFRNFKRQMYILYFIKLSSGENLLLSISQYQLKNSFPNTEVIYFCVGLLGDLGSV